MDAETLARLEELLAEEHHVIQFRDSGWTISHPLRERLDGTLFDCEAFWDHDDPGMRGEFWLLDDGTVGDPYPLHFDGHE